MAMRLRRFSATLSAILLAIPAMGVLVSHASASAKPNLVVIVADDLDTESIGKMPKVQKLLAAAGISFDRSYVPESLCAPSRASFLTGRYPHNTDVRRIDPPHGGYETFHQSGVEESTIATWLRSAGYHTIFIGKYINNYPNSAPDNYIPPGWSRWIAATSDTFYDQYDYTLNEQGTLRHYGTRTEDYFNDVLGRKAIAELQHSHSVNKPFALFLNSSAPHFPVTSAPRHRRLFSGAIAPRVPSFQEADTTDKPRFLRRPLMKDRLVNRIDSEYRGRLRMLAALDESVGAIMKSLRDDGRLSNSYVMITSDNGFHLGQHNLPPSKLTAFEEDIRVPLILRGPGVPRGAHRNHVVVNTDIAPTLAELGGARIPANIDGRSFARLLGSTPPTTSAWRRSFVATLLTPVLIAQCPESSAAPAPLANAAPEPYSCVQPEAFTPTRCTPYPEYWAVRSGRYTYVEYATGDRELYDNVADPYQLQNRYCASSADLRNALSGLLGRLRGCSGASCRQIENEVVTSR
jgi:arylsulfatase A-like enzyme